MTDSVRRCALPGCDKAVEQHDEGGPPRLYCSPEHRIAARKLRIMHREQANLASMMNGEGGEKALADSNGASSDPNPTATWMVSPTPLDVKSGPDSQPAPSAAERKDAAKRIRRRTIATIAAASMVIGASGYVLTDVAGPTSSPSAQPIRTSPAATSVNPEEWVRRAEVVLASINRQLDLINQIEAAWGQSAAHQYLGEPPALQALRERKALLEQQRATILSQLAAIRSLPDATADLEKAQAELDAIERALQTATPNSSTSDPAVETTLRNLAAQREMRVMQRDQSAQVVQTLRAGIEQALATPLPDPTDRTTPLVEQVLALLNGTPAQQPPKADKPPTPPSVVRPREGARQQRRDAGRVAPPEPGPSPLALATQVVAPVTDAVANVARVAGTVLAGPQGGDHDAPPASRTPAAESGRPASLPGAVNQVVSTVTKPVTGLVQGLTGALLGGTDSSNDAAGASSTQAGSSGSQSGQRPSNGSGNGQQSTGSGNGGSTTAASNRQSPSTNRRQPVREAVQGLLGSSPENRGGAVRNLVNAVTNGAVEQITDRTNGNQAGNGSGSNGSADGTDSENVSAASSNASGSRSTNDQDGRSRGNGGRSGDRRASADTDQPRQPKGRNGGERSRDRSGPSTGSSDNGSTSGSGNSSGSDTTGPKGKRDRTGSGDRDGSSSGKEQETTKPRGKRDRTKSEQTTNNGDTSNPDTSKGEKTPRSA